MRPRNKKHLDERFDKCSNIVIADPTSLKGKWRSAFISEGVAIWIRIEFFRL